MFRRFVAALIATAASCAALAAPPAQQVQFDSADGTRLTALLFLPEGRPRGTVLALHGCGGLYVLRGPGKGLLGAQYQQVADLLLAQGDAVLFPDSLGPRGATELCTERLESRRIGQFARRADALGALAWAAAQPWADANRIALVGWSHGATAVLAATDGARPMVRNHPVRPALAIAFHPRCSAALNAGYRPGSPLVLMLAEREDGAPPAACIQLGERVGAQVHVYADSDHGFDNPAGRPRRESAGAGRPVRAGHAGPNPPPREQALARMSSLLAHAFR